VNVLDSSDDPGKDTDRGERGRSGTESEEGVREGEGESIQLGSQMKKS